MTKKSIKVAYGVDFDAVAGWLGSYGGADSPCDISRGLFAGEVGVPRLLELFERHGLRVTWFIPGHSVETFPEQCRQIVAAGHEVGLHGYSHEDPMALSLEQEQAIFEKTIALLTELTGTRPRGYTAPMWEHSPHTLDLLIKYGIEYDHSLMHRDFQPYYLRRGDRWTKIDLSQPAEAWMKPLVRGEETDVVEIPASWHLDDMWPLMFIKTAANSQGYMNPRDLEATWRDQFDWVYREYDYAVFAMTIHPDVSGRPQALLMHERLIAYINSHPGVEWVTFGEIADDFRRRFPRQGG